MPTTPTYALPYPGPDDQAGDAPDQFHDLAVAVEAALSTLIPDTGVLTNLAVTPASGWAVLTNEHRVIGKIMFLHLWLQNNTTAVTANSSGNIAGDPVVATITNAARRPVFDTFGAFRGSLTGGEFQINAATGEIKIASMHSGSSIANGDTVQIGIPYPIP